MPLHFAAAEFIHHLLQAVLRFEDFAIFIFAADPLLNLGVLGPPGIRRADDEDAVVCVDQVDGLLDPLGRVSETVNQVAPDDQIVAVFL